MLAHLLPRARAVEIPPIGSQPRSPTSPLPTPAAPYCWLCFVYLVGQANGAMASSGVPPVLPMSPQLQGLGSFHSKASPGAINSTSLCLSQQQGLIGSKEDYVTPMPCGCVLVWAEVCSEYVKQGIFGIRCTCSSELSVLTTRAAHVAGHPASLRRAVPTPSQQLPFTSHPATTRQKALARLRGFSQGSDC